MTIIENAQPLGFAANHNRILEQAQADYVFVLNDDLIFLPGSIEKMLDFMERPESQDIGVLSPRLLNPDGSLQPSTYAFPTVLTAFLDVSGLRNLIPFGRPLNALAYCLGRGKGRSRFWAHDRTVDVDTFRGACMLCRTRAVRQVGPMITISLAGGEETEWHYRFWKAGWRVVFFPEAEVIHYGGQTRGRMVSLRNERIKALLYFFGQHKSKIAFYTFGMLTWLTLGIRGYFYGIAGRQIEAETDLAGSRIVAMWMKKGPKLAWNSRE